MSGRSEEWRHRSSACVFALATQRHRSSHRRSPTTLRRRRCVVRTQLAPPATRPKAARASQWQLWRPTPPSPPGDTGDGSPAGVDDVDAVVVADAGERRVVIARQCVTIVGQRRGADALLPQRTRNRSVPSSFVITSRAFLTNDANRTDRDVCVLFYSRIRRRHCVGATHLELSDRCETCFCFVNRHI